MLRMDKVQDHHSKEDRRALVSFYKIYHSAGNRFSIDPIPILRCHQNQCRGTRASPVKGKPIDPTNSCRIKKCTNKNVKKKKYKEN